MTMLVDINDPKCWNGGPESHYRAWIDGEYVGYCRKAKQAFYGMDVQSLISALPFKRRDKILFVGAGFGWMQEDFAEAGFKHRNMLSLDTSRWIHANLADNAVVTVEFLDVMKSGDRKIIMTKLKPDWIISEDCLPLFSNDEVLEFCKCLRIMAPKIARWVTPLVGSSQHPQMNWKTLEDWKKLVAPDLVVKRGDSTVA